MLKAFKLRNYKNFKDEISINFEDIAGYQFSTDCISDGILSKMIIYGRNATGKTNLGNAIMDITKMLFQIGYKNEDIFINADATEDFASFSYSFQFDNNEIIYRYTRFSNFDLRDEELIIDVYKRQFQSNTERVMEILPSDVTVTLAGEHFPRKLSTYLRNAYDVDMEMELSLIHI